jgi:hypothetical protein
MTTLKPSSRLNTPSLNLLNYPLYKRSPKHIALVKNNDIGASVIVTHRYCKRPLEIV